MNHKADAIKALRGYESGSLGSLMDATVKGSVYINGDVIPASSMRFPQ